VREKVNEVQRQMAAGANWVLDGRDTGTVVFPDAEVKIYLTADEKVRAERRLNQLRQQGRSDDELVFDRVLQELRERDARDKARPFGALEVPKGAIILDSSELNYKATLGELERHVKESSAWKTTGNAASPSS
jgi:cytidylate kinase